VNEFNSDIFYLKNDNELFEQYALKAFNYQFKYNNVYKEFVNYLKLNPEDITSLNQIPFLPIQFFKSHRISTKSFHHQLFTSSGTTGTQTSKHYVFDLKIYIESYLKAFQFFFGNIEDYCVLALLPSYLEREGSSLVFMVDDLIKKSKHNLSSFYIHDIDDLIKAIDCLKKQNQKTILLGVSYALLDLAEKNITLNDDFFVMETGGMKGKRKEMVKQELHEILKNAFGVSTIYSEYGMTELLSQAYSKADCIYETPPWMKILISEVTDTRYFIENGKSGIINIIDLANWYSCPFLATQDLGKKIGINKFEILGRLDNSDIRGCNLLIQ
jgi:phenylacetate-coenzyme A ligase PaaK-like adenylate-forming protein